MIPFAHPSPHQAVAVEWACAVRDGRSAWEAGGREERRGGSRTRPWQNGAAGGVWGVRVRHAATETHRHADRDTGTRTKARRHKQIQADIQTH